MLSNLDIKRREIFKETQLLIKIIGEFKMAQQDLLLALNECAEAELLKYNAIKTAVIKHKFKLAVKRYFDVYGDKFNAEAHIRELKEWSATEPSKYVKE